MSNIEKHSSYDFRFQKSLFIIKNETAMVIPKANDGKKTALELLNMEKLLLHKYFIHGIK